MKLKNKNCCIQYSNDLNRLMLTGKASDEYIKHITKCPECKNKMHSKVLCGIRALNEK